MKYLLDTHTALWSITEKKKLSKTAETIIVNTSLHICISVVSLWEIAIKISIKKLNFEGGVECFLEEMQKNGALLLGVESSHIKCVETLPFIHRDPFDRMIIAAAKADGMTVLTADENIRKYDVLSAW